jgi:hypothetical protein
LLAATDRDDPVTHDLIAAARETSSRRFGLGDEPEHAATYL